nr:hypothetical protein [Tanacetum cinerariifolium]
MSRDVLTVGSTMMIPLLYRGEYSQWDERFMNYLEEQTDREAMINSIKNEWKQYATMMRQNKNLMDINIDALYNILKKNQRDVNDAMGSKKKTVVVTSDPLALIAKKMKVSKSKEKSANKKQEFVKSDDKKVEKKADEKKRDMSRVKCYNCKKEGHFAKDCKKAKVKDYEYYKIKMLLAKKDKDEQVLLAKDQAWMESSSDSDQEINANMVFMAQIKKVLSDSEANSSSANEKISEASSSSADEKISETVYMIIPSKDNLYNGRKGIGFENPSYVKKAKDLRPTLYDEKVTSLGKLEDDYFQEIINPDFDKIDSPFQQTNSLKPYVLNVILEKIIIDLEDEVVNLLEKEKVNLETIE